MCARDRSSERGFSLVELMIGLLVLAIIMAIAIPNYLAAMRTARETAAIEVLRQVPAAQQLYYSANQTYTDEIRDLIDGKYLAAPLDARGDGYGYRFRLMEGAGGGAGRRRRWVEWSATARPRPADPKARQFYIDQTGLIRFAVGQAANQRSTPLVKTN